MAKFITQLYTVKVGNAKGLFGRAQHRVVRPLIYRSDLLGTTIIIPRGFVTDFSSVPRLGLAYSLFGDTGHASATVHDYACRNGYLKHLAGGQVKVPRPMADQVFKEALEAEGVEGWRIPFMFAGVRIGDYISRVKKLFSKG